MQILITGGAGFIGSHLAERALRDGHEVVVLDNLSTGTLANLFGHPRLRVVEGDIRDPRAVSQAMFGCSLVFHLAAVVGVRRVIADPLAAMETNVDGTSTVLREALKGGAKVVLASSSEVYGLSEAMPFHEDGMRVLGPTTVSRWSYATAKALDEHLLFAYREHGLKGSVVRYFNTFGPRQDASGYAGVVAVFVSAVVAGRPLVVHGDGHQTRCFCFVSDTAEATYRAGLSDKAEGSVVNVGDNREITVLDLARVVAEEAGVQPDIQFVPFDAVFGPRFQDPMRRQPALDAASEILGFRASTELREGIRQTIAWARNTGATSVRGRS